MDGGWIWIRGSCPDHTTARLGSLPTNHSYLFLRSAEQWWKLSSGHVQVFFVEFWFWVPTYFSAGRLNRHQMGSWSSGTCVRELPEIADGNWHWEREREGCALHLLKTQITSKTSFAGFVTTRRKEHVICHLLACHLPFAALETFWRMITMWERSFGGGVVLRTHVRIVTPIGTLSGLEESCPCIRRHARRTMAGLYQVVW